MKKAHLLELMKKDGKFLVANGGTIFLDEIGDMSTSLQAKILRVLESGEIERVGGAETHTVNVKSFQLLIRI